MKRVIALSVVLAVSYYGASAQSGSKTESGHALGPANAPVTLDEYADFECPPCARLSEPLNQLAKEFGPRLRVVFHHCPLDEHKHALEASYAAEAAGLQGKFWEMHDTLYRDQDIWSNSSEPVSLFSVYAMYISLNVKRFKIDMESDEVKARVASDTRKRISLGIHATPSVFINNRQIDLKSLNLDDLRQEIETALKSAKPSSQRNN
jgi:formate-nitrite transporter family protein